LGHIRRVEKGRVSLAEGAVAVAPDALVVHCAAAGLKYPAVVPIWSPGTITLQPVRAGFPCFGAALIGYVEATRDDDEEKNRVCLASCLPDTPVSFARMHVLGGRAGQAFSAQPDIREWANETALNPGRIPPDRAADPRLGVALDRYRQHAAAGFARLAEFAASA
ncbi:MAG TPA: pyridine nucleotide-disulfide oxidoreductase, partial [Propionibacteriaceae bacterium]|nr:pyridine nucleotide-disulfide oxidoreductase [Propionibacteriaceae bacterium]